MTPEEKDLKKKEFLEAFKELGYKNKACEKVGVDNHIPTYWQKKDPKFAMDYDILKAYWKDRRKEELDQIIYESAKTARGFMDRMAWMRSHGFDEYNPKSIVKKEDEKTTEALKKLADKMDKYTREK